jgi:dTMP kinase
MTPEADKFAGRFIVLDGPDGSGKSTQLEMLGAWMRSAGTSVVETHDPGGTVIGDKIRRILLDRDHEEMTIGCEMLLYMASRTQLMGEVIAPAIDAGKCVLCDRWVSSTIAYQAEAGSLSPLEIVAIYEIALRSVKPDLTVILDIPAEVGLSRIRRQADRMEAKGVEFHRKVRQAFLDQARAEPERFLVIDAAGQREEVNERLRQGLLEREFVA